MKPIILQLRKKMHREMAKAQDLIVETLYETFQDAVLHGGTAIWRCYHGNRFSEDIDIYIPRELSKLEAFFGKLVKKGFVLEKKKIGENSLYSSMNIGGATVRFEALFRKVCGHLCDYETAEGNIIAVYSLTPEELIAEKVNAYLKRQKIRDIYDIFFLLRHVRDATATKSKLRQLLDGFSNPVDENELRVLIIEGLVPTVQKMIEYIKRRS